jgi:hypothetical protein
VNLPPGWHAIASSDEQNSFGEELKREVCKDHLLFDMQGKAVARRQNRDDFIFRMDNGRWAWVHLTWKIETRVEWPSSELFNSLDECLDWISDNL